MNTRSSCPSRRNRRRWWNASSHDLESRTRQALLLRLPAAAGKRCGERQTQAAVVVFTGPTKAGMLEGQLWNLAVKHLLHFVLLACAVSSAAAEPVRLAQIQITPTPLTPTPLIAGPNSTACYNGCDMSAMSCQNSCLAIASTVTPGTSTSVPSSSTTSTASCTLGCTSQQLVCKQACSR